MSNFGFLADKKEYELFAGAAIEAEKVYASSPAMSALGSRKALELAVKWVYAADDSIQMPYRDNLQSLIHEQSFIDAVDRNTWYLLKPIVQLGNMAAHTEKNISAADAVMSLKGLFQFIEWIDYCYGTDYVERKFDINAIPLHKVSLDVKKIKEQESLLNEKDSEIERMRKQIEEMSAQLTKGKEKHEEERTFKSDTLSEFETRRQFIDIDLKSMGWVFDGADADVTREYEVGDMMGFPGQKGYCDYVLWGSDGKPLAVIEAKKTTADVNKGRNQAKLYADCLERKFGRRPFMFTSNGFETNFWDDKSGPERHVYSVFSKADLERLIDRRENHKDLYDVEIDDKITNRYYQKEAIRAICDNTKKGIRKNLLVMATGTGKTRTAASLVDVYSRAGYVTNVLFLADRVALVKQAKDAFKEYLPDMTLCNLCSNKDDKNARIVFSTYPTMLNAIDGTRVKADERLFTPAHFDMIIIDESHRSIFKKYRAIFDYFDAILVGLTATPKKDVDRNTYDFFELEDDVPTYAYEYETAVYTDHVLVPYYNYTVDTKFLHDGVKYDELSQKDKERLEEDFIEDGIYVVPEVIPSEKLNRFLFNANTVDMVLQDLMERGIKIEDGEKIGKTIIFAQNKNHAEFILQRFNYLYPEYKGTFAQRVICDDPYAQTVIDDFKSPDKEPQIAVSVDMMDTGIDVPECVNLVFFKQVKSKTKFWQMIGRGTRLCPGLFCTDSIDGNYADKKRFLIFDYCGNFEYFSTHTQEYSGRAPMNVSERIFDDKIKLIMRLQTSAYAADNFQNWRSDLIKDCLGLVASLNTDRVSVRSHIRYVEKYKNEKEYQDITEIKQSVLEKDIAPLVHINDKDEDAKRFDAFMYGLIIRDMDGDSLTNVLIAKLRNICEMLEKKVSIPQVKAKLPIIQRVESDDFWKVNDIPEIENARKELRSLMQFISSAAVRTDPVYTNIKDSVMHVSEGTVLPSAYDFEGYKSKVSRYIKDHKDSLPIHKLTHNEHLTKADYAELERVLVSELGTKDDYEKAYGDKPFGLLVRKVAKMDHEAAMAEFSDFINDQSLNQKQIAFVNKVINYIETNGYLDERDLLKTPFDRPTSFIKLFDPKHRSALVAKIKEINDNAVQIG